MEPSLIPTLERQLRALGISPPSSGQPSCLIWTFSRNYTTRSMTQECKLSTLLEYNETLTFPSLLDAATWGSIEPILARVSILEWELACHEQIW